LQPSPGWTRQRVVRIAGAIGALVALTVALSACSGAGNLATVTGIGAACGGPAGPSGQLPGWLLEPVRVSAIAHGRIVASDVVSYRTDHDRYRLSLRPGKYAIASPGDPRGTVVTVQAGQRIRLNLPDLCA
jgi:hypothetical protein